MSRLWYALAPPSGQSDLMWVFFFSHRTSFCNLCELFLKKKKICSQSCNSCLWPWHSLSGYLWQRIQSTSNKLEFSLINDVLVLPGVIYPVLQSSLISLGLKSMKELLNLNDHPHALLLGSITFAFL